MIICKIKAQHESIILSVCWSEGRKLYHYPLYQFCFNLVYRFIWDQEITFLSHPESEFSLEFLFSQSSLSWILFPRASWDKYFLRYIWKTITANKLKLQIGSCRSKSAWFHVEISKGKFFPVKNEFFHRKHVWNFLY